jgi:hypothetical protein
MLVKVTDGIVGEPVVKTTVDVVVATDERITVVGHRGGSYVASLYAPRAPWCVSGEPQATAAQALIALAVETAKRTHAE